MSTQWFTQLNSQNSKHSTTIGQNEEFITSSAPIFYQEDTHDLSAAVGASHNLSAVTNTMFDQPRSRTTADFGVGNSEIDSDLLGSSAATDLRANINPATMFEEQKDKANVDKKSATKQRMGKKSYYQGEGKGSTSG